jgi:hypothetical protein
MTAQFLKRDGLWKYESVNGCAYLAESAKGVDAPCARELIGASSAAEASAVSRAN